MQRDAFLTGSRTYGTPREDSDIDVVCFLSPAQLIALADMAEYIESYDADRSISMRFGKLNLIGVSDEGLYVAWSVGTNRCLAEKPVSRDAAKAIFAPLFRALGPR